MLDPSLRGHYNQAVTRDLRKYATTTNKRLILGGIGLLYLVGGGLIYAFYGREAAISGVICLTLGLAPLVLAWLALNLVGWLAKRADPDR